MFGQYATLTGMVLIDVRTKEEFNTGHIEGAVNIPLQDIISGRLPKYSKDTEIGLYCRNGKRSENAFLFLDRHGFSNLKDYGGISNVPDDLDII